MDRWTKIDNQVTTVTLCFFAARVNDIQIMVFAKCTPSTIHNAFLTNTRSRNNPYSAYEMIALYHSIFILLLECGIDTRFLAFSIVHDDVCTDTTDLDSSLALIGCASTVNINLASAHAQELW